MRRMQNGMWNFMTSAFGAWIILDMMLSKQHDTIGRKDLDLHYDFIIGKTINIIIGFANYLFKVIQF